MSQNNQEGNKSKKNLIAEVKSLHKQIADLKKAEEERQYAYKLQMALYKISDTVNSVKNLSELFKQVHKIVNELTKATNFYIALYDKSSDMISFPYFIDKHDLPPATMKIGQGLTSYVIKTGKSLLASPDTFKALVKEKKVINLGTPSVDWLGVPLKDVDNTVFGVMVVQSYVKGIRYSEEDKRILTFISSQVAMAIKRKNLEEALKESEEKYRSFSNQLPLGVYRTTEAGKFLFVNQALVNILDYKTIDEFFKKT
ncbi:GAF domain-containing protein, partial [bacterium]|nr:GAF domain-containing protein [bacterium]